LLLLRFTAGLEGQRDIVAWQADTVTLALAVLARVQLSVTVNVTV